MKTATKTEGVAYLRRRLGLARKRMRYWSGCPSFSGFGYNPGKVSNNEAECEYEMALCDAYALANQIGEQTGACPRVRDIKNESRVSMSAIRW
ncbi:hypothetical protein [Alienimonas sp. DA493]|uniref:hypothetical protein n=1 Tax=Alienimonas sp. DA493 TaxID=3373605 RepID=UPI003754F2F4